MPPGPFYRNRQRVGWKLPKIMASLLERWPSLSVPYVDLGARPVRVFSARFDGRQVDVLDEREAAPDYGGNKVRKLEYLLAEAVARGATDLIATGAAGSHHVLATAIYGKRLGLKTHAVLIPQPDHPHVRSQLSAIARECVEVYPTSGPIAAAAQVAWLLSRLRFGATPYLVPVGGSNAAGTAGWLKVGLDLADGMKAGTRPQYRAVYVAVGSAGTAAGLLAGLRLGGATTEVVGVRVVEPFFSRKKRVLRMAKASVDWLRKHGAPVEIPALDGFRLQVGWYAGGYGRTDERIRQVIKTAANAGWALDPTYTGKALGACLEEHTGEPVLYVHTVDGRPDRDDPLPEGLRALLIDK